MNQYLLVFSLLFYASKIGKKVSDLKKVEAAYKLRRGGVVSCAQCKLLLLWC